MACLRAKRRWRTPIGWAQRLRHIPGSSCGHRAPDGARQARLIAAAAASTACAAHVSTPCCPQLRVSGTQSCRECILESTAMMQPPLADATLCGAGKQALAASGRAAPVASGTAAQQQDRQRDACGDAAAPKSLRGSAGPVELVAAAMAAVLVRGSTWLSQHEPRLECTPSPLLQGCCGLGIPQQHARSWHRAPSKLAGARTCPVAPPLQINRTTAKQACRVGPWGSPQPQACLGIAPWPQLIAAKHGAPLRKSGSPRKPRPETTAPQLEICTQTGLAAAQPATRQSRCTAHCHRCKTGATGSSAP